MVNQITQHQEFATQSSWINFDENLMKCETPILSWNSERNPAFLEEQESLLKVTDRLAQQSFTFCKPKVYQRVKKTNKRYKVAVAVIAILVLVVVKELREKKLTFSLSFEMYSKTNPGCHLLNVGVFM